MPVSIKKNKSTAKNVSAIKKEPTQKAPVQKGYNEKNPTQEQGSFKPDNAGGK